MAQHTTTPHSAGMRICWTALILFSGVVACQEEHDPVNTPPQSNNPTGTSQIPPPPIESNTPGVSPESTPSTGSPRNITGEVVAIDGKTYIVKDSENKEIRIEANSMTLVDESIGVGDKAEIRYSADNQPTAIRKVRGTL